MKIESLDTVFSEFIRLRDSDENGYCKCISCGRLFYYKELDCGHFVNRKHKSTRFDEKNCNAQCKSCNSYDEGNSVGYAKGLIEKHGQDVLDLLIAKKNTTTKISQFDIDTLGAMYREKVKELKKSKTLRP